ncbi:MAG: WXG100 family type VII secretion target [Chloroflexi bacterium]|jgi:WXG100 family type VII secretion target|nr:WXG100 family type VII secretion target [Anaerolineaceae bacterium]NMB88714.1 WXG100 family type VII secretion target [Chloroflexota bacterium]
MAILHMETETAHSAQSAIVAAQQDFNSRLQTMKASVEELRPNWSGNSATQFFQEFDQWTSAMSSFLDELNKMGANLQSEINEWEETAKTA